jgi:polyisoprenoid-binding protein YceI
MIYVMLSALGPRYLCPIKKRAEIMKKRYTPLICIIVCLFILPFPMSAQVKYQVGPKPELKVSGTSTLHDWEMVSTQATGEGTLVLEGGNLKEVQDLTIQMPAESIKSGKGAMDKNTYAALNTKKHKLVKFSLSDITKTGDNVWKAKGKFTIAGVTKDASFDVKSSQVGSGYNFQGKHAFKLTDYQIDPPTALLGTVKTGDEVAIHFNVTLQPTQ